MSKSINRQRQESYMTYPDTRLRKAIYSLCKSLQEQGVTLPLETQEYVDHCDAVKRQIPKPDQKSVPKTKPDKG